MELSFKTLALVAMASISRSSTLGIMSRAFSYKENEGEGEEQLFVEFLPGSQEKTGTNREGIFLPSLQEEPALDPVAYLEAYKGKVSGRNSSSQEDSSLPLWLSTKKPHRPIKPVTLAGWLKRAMEKGGVDTSVFKAHSVRSAAPAHFRKEKALSMAQILARGGWKASGDGVSRTFILFYDRSVD